MLHISTAALNYLKGVPLPAYTPTNQDDELYCGSSKVGPTAWLTLASVSLWERGKLTVLPNCPSCSVAWDEAMEVYNSRK